MQHKRRNNNGGGQGGGRHFNNNRGGGGGRRYSKGFGGQGGHSGGENDQQNVARVRRQAQTNREKFMNMARDALSHGDRVQAEYYLQHAEHYFRVLSALPPEEPRHRHHNNPQQDGAQAEASGGAQEQSAEGSQPSENEEPVINTSATALPSFITGVRDMPRAAGDEN